MGAFNARYLLGAENATEVPLGGGAVSRVKTTNCPRPIASDAPSSWTGLGAKALAKSAVIGAIFALFSLAAKSRNGALTPDHVKGSQTGLASRPPPRELECLLVSATSPGLRSVSGSAPSRPVRWAATPGAIPVRSGARP